MNLDVVVEDCLSSVRKGSSSGSRSGGVRLVRDVVALSGNKSQNMVWLY